MPGWGVQSCRADGIIWITNLSRIIRTNDWIKEDKDAQGKVSRHEKKGGKVTIFMDVKEYEKLMEDLEELDDIRAYDAAKQSGEAPIPFEQMAKNIQASRK